MKKIFWVQNALGYQGVYCPIGDNLAEAIQQFEKSKYKLHSGGIAGVQVKAAIRMIAGEIYEQKKLHQILNDGEINDLAYFLHQNNLTKAVEELSEALK